ncbi:MAG: pilin [Patescibacteria group bacterium]
MKHKLLSLVLGLGLLSMFAGAVGTNTAFADSKSELCSGANLDISGKTPDGCGDTSQCTDNKDDKTNYCPASKLNTLINNIVNILSVIVGVVAVIMIIYGGFRYITSGGDSGSVTTAKNTIIYALVGLVIVALAQVIVKFVLNSTKI